MQTPGEENKIYFRSEEHRERFREALSRMEDKAIYDGNRIDQYYGPALLMLTLDIGMWELVQSYITRNGIDFERYLERGYFSTTERIMAKLAAHLFNETHEGPTPTDLVVLDDRNFEACIMAIRMRRSPYQLADIEA